jgi:DNA-binding XRE family transcriptional regulator
MKRFKLKAWRARRGLTQADVAQRLGVATSFFCLIETGKKNPSQQLLNSFEKTFKTENTLRIFDLVESEKEYEDYK